MSTVSEIAPHDKGEIDQLEQSPEVDFSQLKNHRTELHEAQLASLSESKGIIQTMREDTKAMLVVIVALVCPS
jgi:hypothetical protein